jgi:hypothetical protein
MLGSGEMIPYFLFLHFVCHTSVLNAQEKRKIAGQSRGSRCLLRPTRDCIERVGAGCVIVVSFPFLPFLPRQRSTTCLWVYMQGENWWDVVFQEANWRVGK